MIAFAESIADKHCYELDSGLYFDTSTVANYGALARAKTEDGEGRIDAVDGKRNAADFAIWRKTPEGETRQMEWDSAWGKGAPGWHLECSVMSEALLGLPFDIHTGGIDHREIHHPNEIAQNQARCHSDASGANIWMHNNFLIERSGKMSKSSGEFLRVQLLIDKGFHPLAYRLMCLQAHYRSELEFSWEGLQAAFVRLKRMVMGVEKIRYQFVDNMRNQAEAGASVSDDWLAWQLNPIFGAMDAKLAGIIEQFDTAISEDLNTAVVLTLIDQVINMQKIEVQQKIGALGFFNSVLGLNLVTASRTQLRIRPKAAIITEAEIEAALAARKEARAAKEFAKSDAIRDDLIAKGVEVMDGDPLGWDWKLDV
jgi:cysteinyl-tRNA synthetase